jgi:hypothetical protein
MNVPALRFLADESCDFAVVRALRAEGYDVLAVSEVMRRSDDKGRPICPFGYPLKANGFDPSTSSGHRFDRRRHKWACFQACRNDAAPVVPVQGTTYPPDECPFLDRPYGQLINVSERFKAVS